MAVLSDRQINLIVLQRMVLGLGVILGFLPLLAIPFIAFEEIGLPLVRASILLTCITLLPACLLAFWRRRIACVWLIVNATLLLVALAQGWISKLRHQSTDAEISILAIALCLFVSSAELFGWPLPLITTEDKYAEHTS